MGGLERGGLERAIRAGVPGGPVTVGPPPVADRHYRRLCPRPFTRTVKVRPMDNRPGELAHLARALAMRGTKISHIASVGAGEVACAFISSEDENAIREVLHGLGHPLMPGPGRRQVRATPGEHWVVPA